LIVGTIVASGEATIDADGLVLFAGLGEAGGPVGGAGKLVTGVANEKHIGSSGRSGQALMPPVARVFVIRITATIAMIRRPARSARSLTSRWRRRHGPTAVGRSPRGFDSPSEQYARQRDAIRRQGRRRPTWR
jgi:hypothetical protein